ncbi:methionine-tRNA ligase [Allomyces macrogynus ATCC 38327]|uniref:methionine--tRNA ligase n=1 Tax=Allomyces macrogynus (strain ATCC 38327) TaxID=578462 RepID=A0A0L0S1Z8_ALLM3|nr:methionine-tRNA ligase [Allomyces macrogynus ATCC 38327]|eukprot:KNE56592.1 methionine-tRNA ligase [Allomyces macrogynus ATCC 38327]
MGPPAIKYITTPIFYVNSSPHIGHLYTAVLADTLARWYRFRGHPVKLATGTDEHGLKIHQAAAKNKTENQAFCDQVSGTFQTLFDRANISYTDFIRTTEPRHKAAVQAIWQRIESQKYLYKDTYEGWYSVSDEAFLADNDVVDSRQGKIAKESGQLVEWTKEETIKFKLGEFKGRVADWVTTNNVITPASRAREVLQMTQSADLADLSVSRPASRVQWGIPVSSHPDQLVYVWLDALTNYLTVCGYPDADIAQNGWPAAIHVIGKDIVKFHAVYWPAFLMAAGLPLPQEILAHAHWTVDRVKMSKSRGNVVEPNAILDEFGVDPVRFFLILNGGIENDGDWSNDLMKKVYKKELAGQIGNLFARASSAAINPSSIYPVLDLAHADVSDHVLRARLTALPSDFVTHMEARHFNKALTSVVHAVADANRYFAENAPWTLDHDSPRLQSVLHHAFETLRLAGLLLQCVTPTKSAELLEGLGVPESARGWDACAVGKHGASAVRGGVLFPKL